MKERYRLLGDFIRQVDVRNTDGKEEKLLGRKLQEQVEHFSVRRLPI